jgi:hypothetical protein
MCLWNSALDSFGPMVIARIKQESHGSRIVGRAGSDLNGLVALSIMTPAMAFLLVTLASAGDTSVYFFFLLICFGLGIPAAFWSAHSDKREADPLVRFIRRTVEPRTAESISQAAPEMTTIQGVRLLDCNRAELQPTAAGVRAAIEGLGADRFVIVERGPEEYMQVLSRKADYLLEKREGSTDHHYQLLLPKGELGEAGMYDQSEARLIAILTDYLYGRTEARSLNWKRVQ